VRRRAAALAAVVLGCLAAGAPARAHSPGSLKFVVSASGELVVDWSGDPATCEPLGRCGMRGTVAWRLPERGTMSLGRTRSRGGRRAVSGEVSLDLFGGNVIARVRTGDRLCADTGAGGGHIELSSGDGGRTVTISAPAVGEYGVGSLSTRCAGPLGADIAGALPVLRVPYERLARGRTSLRLAGTAGFAAGGLRGTVTSSVTLRIGRPRREKPDPADLDDLSGLVLAQSRFRVAEVRGDVTAALAGASGGDCVALDTCGVTGAQRYAPALTTGRVELFAYAPRGRGRRAVRAALGLAPGGVAPGIGAEGYGAFAGAGRIEASVGRPGEPPCVDSVPLRGMALSVQPRGTRASVTIDPDTDGPVRTRCPGPFLVHRRGIATADVPLRDLGRRRVELTFDRPASLLDDGWTGQARPALTVVLERVPVLTPKAGASTMAGWIGPGSFGRSSPP
jgi:hypothetical protein